MTRVEKVREAQRLRAQGLAVREIAERMGVAHGTASVWLTDPDLSKQRARRARYSRPCVDCGAPTGGAGGFASRVERCRACSEEHQHDARYWTPEAIVGALQCWAEEHGGIPPSAGPWLTYGTPPRMPSVDTVLREFGSWNAAIEAAGYAPRRPGTYGRDGEDPDLCREIRARYAAGEPMADLAWEYGCHPFTIRSRIRKAESLVGR